MFQHVKVAVQVNRTILEAQRLKVLGPKAFVDCSRRDIGEILGWYVFPSPNP